MGLWMCECRRMIHKLYIMLFGLYSVCERRAWPRIGCSPCTQEVEGSAPTGGTCPNDFFRSNRPGYPHPVSSELENSGIRVAVGDCSVTERRRWRPPYQTGKTVHVHAKHYKHNEDRRTAPGVCGNGSVPLSHSGDVVTRIGIHTLSLWMIQRHLHIDKIHKNNIRSFDMVQTCHFLTF